MSALDLRLREIEKRQDKIEEAIEIILETLNILRGCAYGETNR